MDEKRIKTLTEIMERPLPEITPEQERELAELEELMSKPPIEDLQKKTLTEIMERPLLEITPEQKRELDELEEFFGHKS